MTAFESGQDIHSDRSACFPRGAEAVTEKWRKAKMVNFGVLYGCLFWSVSKAWDLQEGCERNH